MGFPGETDKDFDATLQLVRDIGFAQAFSFKYSRRPGTAAGTMANQIPEDVKDTRLQTLQTLLRRQQEHFNQQTVGQVLPILIEIASRVEGYSFGRSPFLQPVEVATSSACVGQEIQVKIERAAVNKLVGVACLERKM